MCMQFPWPLKSPSSILACTLPTLGSTNSVDSENSVTVSVTNRISDTIGVVGRISNRLEEPESPQKKSQQDTQQEEEPKAPLNGGCHWPPHSTWYTVAAIFLVSALVEDWKVLDRSPDCIEKG